MVKHSITVDGLKVGEMTFPRELTEREKKDASQLFAKQHGILWTGVDIIVPLG